MLKQLIDSLKQEFACLLFSKTDVTDASVKSDMWLVRRRNLEVLVMLSMTSQKILGHSKVSSKNKQIIFSGSAKCETNIAEEMFLWTCA